MIDTRAAEDYLQLHYELHDLTRLLFHKPPYRVCTDEIIIQTDVMGRCEIRTVGYETIKPYPEGDYDPYTIPFIMLQNLIFISTHALCIWHRENENILKNAKWDKLIILQNRIRRLVTCAMIYGKIVIYS